MSGIDLQACYDQMRRFFSVFAAGESELVVEVRAPDMPSGNMKYPPKTIVGYFDVTQFSPVGKAIARGILDLKPDMQPPGVYVLINPVSRDNLALANNRFKSAKDCKSVADADILCRRLFFIDVDPVRAKKYSATDSEKAEAKITIDRIREDLDGRGWPSPMLIDSGNGFHLWYRINLPADDGGRVERFLKALAAKYDTAGAKVDTSVFNASRISKIPGTFSRKGDHTDDRPHRMARVLESPDILDPVAVELIEAVIEEYSSPAERLANELIPEPSRDGTHKRFNTKVSKSAITRCRKYLEKLPSAIEGQHGSNQTFKAARIIWNDFGLDFADGWPLLCEWNQRCIPPWPEAGGSQSLRRKWDEAEKQGPGPEGRGFRLKQVGNQSNDGARLVRHVAAGGGERDPKTSPHATATALPEIVHSDRQYREVEFEAAQALIAANRPPQVFVGNGGGLVEIHRPDQELPPRARELDAAAMRPIFARVANWYKLVSDGEGGKQQVDDFPPPALLTSFPARGTWPGVPALRSIVTYPVFSPTWELLTTTGYHEPSGLYCHLEEIDLPPVPDRPTVEELTSAKNWILTELLGDFPFVDQASRANAVAMLLLPAIRHAIDGPTPLAVADAPVEGTGKSLLVEASMLTTIGEIPEAMTADMREEERDKTLIALLLEGQPIVFFDNANHKLDSASFANTLTARYKRGRILGESRTANAWVNVCWVLTGNNFTCSREIARRAYWSRIDAGVETPSEREQFRHPDLLGWVKENRGKLLWSILVLVRNWLAGGSIPGTRTLGKFERWSRTVGGILMAAGIDGFLDNADAFRRLCADQAGELPEFIKGWWAKYSDQSVISSDLFDLAKDSLESVLTAENDDGKRKQLGRFLKKSRDRVVGKHRIRVTVDADGKESKDYAGRPRYRLEEKQITDKQTTNEEFEMSG